MFLKRSVSPLRTSPPENPNQRPFPPARELEYHSAVPPRWTLPLSPCVAMALSCQGQLEAPALDRDRPMCTVTELWRNGEPIPGTEVQVQDNWARGLLQDKRDQGYVRDEEPRTAHLDGYEVRLNNKRQKLLGLHLVAGWLRLLQLL